MINIEKAFVTENRSVYDFFQQPGFGFYIPLYQREYSWGSDNIEQLLDDILKGIERLTEDKNAEEDEIRFLGTIITVAENNKNNIQPHDPQALPSRTEKLIDGQQRLSTIAIFSTLLHKHIGLVLNKIKKESLDAKLYDEVEEVCNIWREKLVVIYSFDLGRGKPRRKPKIIRGQKDKWIREGDINQNYTSPIARYLASYIDAVENLTDAPQFDKEKFGSNVSENLKEIDKWIRKTVLNAHNKESSADDFPSAQRIINIINQDNVWDYRRVELTALVNATNAEHKRSSINYILCELVQLFSVCHYLVDRCCFTIIQPSNDDWAFDMFQSLNATGTPLTAIETFKPRVVSLTEDKEESFKGSKNEASFNKLETLFKNTKNAAEKSKLTADFLTSFAIAFDSFKLSSHFSHQRKRLESYFNERDNYGEQIEFVKFLGDYAEFYRVAIDYDGKEANTIPLITGKDAELASILLLFLKKSNHRMSYTILGYFYKDVIDGLPNSTTNFIEATKTVAAFYTIWRAAHPNAGLDNVYREFFKGEENTWQKRRHLTVEDLKTHFQNALKTKHGIEHNFETWSARAKSFLKYNTSASVCEFALFVSAHDTIEDYAERGLMKVGVEGVAPYLDLKHWMSEDLKTIEHIAPKKHSNNWDLNLYGDDEMFNSLGNLTLLPANVNSSMGNGNWQEKYLYYKHLSESDPAKLQELQSRSSNSNINLSKEAIEILKKAKYCSHIKPITAINENGVWDLALVNKRNERILSILWRRISGWLF
jgi:uncharacterized protein with ParB-like and HNH nuclease domain